MKFSKRNIIALSALCASLGTSQMQAASEREDTTLMLQEISVTAIKQGLDLERQATAATLLTKRQIERQKVYSARNVSDMVPNLVIPDYGSRVTSTIYVRGMGARIDQPVVGLNIDNVPIISKDNYDFDLADMNRVEMLRGPQSTLYGRNTMGGVINIYTLSPLQYQGVRLMGEYSSGNTRRAAASVYHKPTDRLGISLSLQANATDGFFTNEFNGEKCDWEKQYGGRMKLQWLPADRWMIENTLAVTNTRQGGYPYKHIETGKIAYGDTCFYKRTAVTDGFTVHYQGDNYKASSITSLQYSDDNMTLDQDFRPVNYFTLTQARRDFAVTQDFVSRGTVNDHYNWLGGVFAFFRNYDMDAPVTFLKDGINDLILKNRNEAIPQYPLVWNSDNFLLDSDFNNKTFGVALYHESTYKSGNWTFTAGVRGDFEYGRLEYWSNCNTDYTMLNAATGTAYKQFAIDIHDNDNLSKTFFEILPKATATYALPGMTDGKVFATVSRGYKAGGFNTQMFSDVLQQKMMFEMGMGYLYDLEDVVSYKPETAWDFEIGTSLGLFDNRLRLNLDAFYIDCTNQQITVFPAGNTTGRIMTNAGQSRSFGAELEARAAITANFGINASYGYTNAKFVKFDNGISDFSGNYVPYAPSNTVFAETYYQFGINGCGDWLRSITLNANSTGTGKIYWNESNTVSQPFYALVGASIRLAGRNYSLDLWGKNLTATDYDTFYFVSVSNAFLQQGKPRTFGATLRINI